MVRYWWNRWRAWWYGWPSWRVIYPDGVSWPLRYPDASTRCKLFGGLRVEYCRGADGRIIPPQEHR